MASNIYVIRTNIFVDQYQQKIIVFKKKKMIIIIRYGFHTAIAPNEVVRCSGIGRSSLTLPNIWRRK